MHLGGVLSGGWRVVLRELAINASWWGIGGGSSNTLRIGGVLSGG
jgi:hypothetical protein